MRTILFVIVMSACLIVTAAPVEADPNVREPDDQDNTWTQETECLAVDYTQTPPVYWYEC